jgi:hypothetical protein
MSNDKKHDEFSVGVNVFWPNTHTARLVEEAGEGMRYGTLSVGHEKPYDSKVYLYLKDTAQIEILIEELTKILVWIEAKEGESDEE